MKRISHAIVLMAIFLVIAIPWNGYASPGYSSAAGKDDGGSFAYNMSFNRIISLPIVRIDVKRVPAAQVDSYWVDSWTADGDLTPWHTPEKYSFTRGDVVECVFQFQQTPGEFDFIRYDGFYFCGETDPMNYIAYGWADFGTIPPN